MNPPSHSCSSVPSAAKKISAPRRPSFCDFWRFLRPSPQRFGSVALSLALALLATAPAHATEEFFDRLSTALSTHSLDGFFRARVSGLLDAEAYHLPKPAPALLETTRTDFFQPRLTLFLDAQFGRSVYLFAQARGDTGFDPADGPARQRLDEYALRLTPWRDARASLQVGKFATIVGNGSDCGVCVMWLRMFFIDMGHLASSLACARGGADVVDLRGIHRVINHGGEVSPPAPQETRLGDKPQSGFLWRQPKKHQNFMHQNFFGRPKKPQSQITG
jgi:hypothetical protein